METDRANPPQSVKSLPTNHYCCFLTSLFLTSASAALAMKPSQEEAAASRASATGASTPSGRALERRKKTFVSQCLSLT